MVNKLKLAVVAFLLPLIAFAQSYPSPTFNNVTVQGTLTAATPAFTNPLPVSSGGTGFSSFTTGNVLVGAAGGGLTTVGTTSSGLPLISSGTGFPPVFTPLTLAGGGTSATTATQARTNLGAAATSSGLNQFAATTSAQLAGVISDETGTGSLVFANSPTLTGSPVVPGYAPLASPALTGTPTAPTAALSTNTTQIATTAFVIANAVSTVSPAFTGTPTAPTAAAGTSTTQLATTAFVSGNTVSTAQALTNVTSSRSFGTTFTNSTGRPIVIYVIGNATASPSGLTCTISGIGLGASVVPQSGQAVSWSSIVPSGATYACASTTVTLTNWYELR